MNNIQCAFDFFYLFSRFEFALKALKYYDQTERDVKIDWSRFALEHNDRFKIDHPDIKEVVNYYLENPPQKQVVQDGEIAWSGTVPDLCCQLDLLLLYIHRVRNNLFHGGKFKGMYFDNPNRNKELLENGIKILNYCALLNPEIKDAIESTY